MKRVVVVQARTGSSRLRNKVLLPLAGRPLLQRMLERVKAARTDFDLVVATSSLPEDEPIRMLCGMLNVRCFSGHPTDLLDRHYQAGRITGADIVAKVPSDCPLIDPDVIDQVFRFQHQHSRHFDFVSNLHPATFPDGNDVEVLPMDILHEAWVEARHPLEREHTTPFIWTRPGRYRIGNVEWATGLNYSLSHRWTIDYVEDYAFISAVYHELWTASRPVFSLRDILDLLRRRPDLGHLNAVHRGKSWQTLNPSPVRQAVP